MSFKTIFLLLGFALILTPAGADEPNAREDTYDATGTWSLDMGATRLLMGDCHVTDDEGYTESVTIVQTGRDYTFRTGTGLEEAGTTDGKRYSHTSRHDGQDISGLGFSLTADSRFTLTSADTASGQTRLDIRYSDGSQCTFEVGFSGTRQ